MNKYIKLTLTLLMLSLKVTFAQQPSIGYFPFNNTLSITSDPERLLFVDGRLETNTFFGNLNPEIALCFNLKRSVEYNLYSGLSCKSNIIDGFVDGDYIGGYSVMFGSRFKPFVKHKNVHLLFELSPYFNKEFDSAILRTYAGVSYRFGKS